jgi:hypothetical protein
MSNDPTNELGDLYADDFTNFLEEVEISAPTLNHDSDLHRHEEIVEESLGLLGIIRSAFQIWK